INRRLNLISTAACHNRVGESNADHARTIECTRGERESPMSHLQRAGWRWLIILLLSIAPSVPGSPDVSSAAQAADNPIVVENQQPGTDAWYIWKYPNIADDTHQQIKGYASAVSVNKGEGI